MSKKYKSLYRFLLETEAELLIRKKKMDTEAFEKEIAVSNILYAIKETLNKIGDKGEN